MLTEIYVISDLHLGGEAGEHGDPGFQICPQPNQEALTEFILNLEKPTIDKDVRVILNGDIVDFLADKQAVAFTSDAQKALYKLRRIVASTEPIWSALADFVRGQGALTLMLGNHDLEMSFPLLREYLKKRLGEGRVDFIYDNEAFTMDSVLVEHGNRYDAWNAVAHGALRRIRSRMSRGLPADKFPVMPGSRLVIDVMNPIKKEYSFVDLLKPETAGVLPILAALGVGGISEIWDAYTQYRRKAAVDYNEEFEPRDETYIANVPSKEKELFDIAQNIAAGGDATAIGLIDFTGLRAEISEAKRRLRREALHRVFFLEKTAEHHRKAFEITHEEKEYLKPAQAAARRGFKVIVMGHTHLVKRKSLENAIYLNTGTWADLIRVPPVVWGENADLAKKTLDSFVNDLEADEVKQWRCSVPTYAKILLDGDELIESDTNVFFADSNEVVSDEGLAKRLSKGV